MRKHNSQSTKPKQNTVHRFQNTNPIWELRSVFWRLFVLRALITVFS